MKDRNSRRGFRLEAIRNSERNAVVSILLISTPYYMMIQQILNNEILVYSGWEGVCLAKAVVLQWVQFPPGNRVAPAGS